MLCDRFCAVTVISSSEFDAAAAPVSAAAAPPAAAITPVKRLIAHQPVLFVSDIDLSPCN
jgi:hypothetical protein